MPRNFCHKFGVEGHNSIELITFIFPSYALGEQLDQSKLFFLSELCPCVSSSVCEYMCMFRVYQKTFFGDFQSRFSFYAEKSQQTNVRPFGGDLTLPLSSRRPTIS